MYKRQLLNCYFPPDPQTIIYNDDELSEMQNEIETILNSTEYDDVIIGCDSNWDKVRQSGFSVSMERWVNRIGLVDLWNEFPGVQYTHLHTDLSSMSTLDRFFVNERLVQYIESAGVLHLADNPSRHSPIMLRLKVGEIKKREEVNVIPVSYTHLTLPTKA